MLPLSLVVPIPGARLSAILLRTVPNYKQPRTSPHPTNFIIWDLARSQNSSCVVKISFIRIQTEFFRLATSWYWCVWNSRGWHLSWLSSLHYSQQTSEATDLFEFRIKRWDPELWLSLCSHLRLIPAQSQSSHPGPQHGHCHCTMGNFWCFSGIPKRCIFLCFQQSKI